MLSDAREWASKAAREFGFASEHCFQVKLAVSEAVANAIQHGSATPDDPVHISARERAGALVFEVRDTGVLIKRTGAWDETAERGRGLGLVALMMDEVELEPSERGSLLRFAKRL
ncbi:MAG: ATP-binding protein [Thermoleophilaceae bacterium]